MLSLGCSGFKHEALYRQALLGFVRMRFFMLPDCCASFCHINVLLNNKFFSCFHSIKNPAVEQNSPKKSDYISIFAFKT